MRTRKAILAATALAVGGSLTIGVPFASAVAPPFADGTILVADQGARLGNGGVFAIAPNGVRTTIFNQGTAVDVASDDAGNVYAASCNVGAIIKIPADHSTPQWLAAKSCPSAVAVEPTGDVIFSAEQAIWRVPADGSAAPSLVADSQSAISLAEDDNGDIWFADGGGDLGVVVAGSTEGVLVDRGAVTSQVRSVRFGAAHTLVVATAFGENAVRLSPDLRTRTEVAAAGGYATGAVVNASGTVFVADDTNRRIVSARRNGTPGVFASGLDDPRGLSIYPEVPSAARAVTATTLSTTSPAAVTVSTPVTLRAAVDPADTGFVQFSIDGLPLGSAAPVRNGVAALRTTLPAGTDDVVATYLGSASSAPSRSAAVRFTVAVERTTTTLTSTTPATAPQNEGVHLSIDVTARHGVPGGLVEIQANNKTVDGAALDGSGHADLTITLPPGTQKVRAVYYGDGSSFGGSRSALATFELTTPYAPTLSTDVTTGTPAEDGSVPVTIDVTVAGFAGRAVPTGTITADTGFTCGPLVPAVRGVRASAECTGSVQPGFHEVALDYSGDAGYAAGSTTAPVFAWGGGGGGEG